MEERSRGGKTERKEERRGNERRGERERERERVRVKSSTGADPKGIFGLLLAATARGAPVRGVGIN